MQIQINAPHIEPADFAETAEETLRARLAPFEAKLTRVEVHVRDVNGHKGGQDKRCVIEARPRGLDPLTAEHVGEHAPDALKHAVHKLERVLQTRFGKLEARDR